MGYDNTFVIAGGDFFEAEVETIPEATDVSKDAESLSRAVTEQFEGYVKLNRKIPPESVSSISEINAKSCEGCMKTP